MTTVAFTGHTSLDVDRQAADYVTGASRRSWILRIATLGVVVGLALWNVFASIEPAYLATGEYDYISINYLKLFGGIVLIHTAVVLVCAWTLYRNPAARGVVSGLYKVAVIIPIYNQENMIEKVIEAVLSSTYGKIEVVAVNDGSTDGTWRVLEDLKNKHESLTVLHKRNAGKRRALASGFRHTKADIVVLMDSDSIVHPMAIEELVKAFESDSKIGAVVGNARVLNSTKNLLTKCQDVWYDYSFNVYKACESCFSNVTCCSGCLAAYRREAIEGFIDAWAEWRSHDSDDSILTNILLAGSDSWFAKTTLKNAAQFDDSEDRILTAQSLQRWKSVYVASALVFTDVPETIGKYFRQQLRWKKGYIRSNAFASTFMWRRNSLMSFVFYLDYLMSFLLPLIVVFNVVYQPLAHADYLSSLTFTSGLALMGLVHGLDYRARVAKNNNTWKYKPLMIMVTMFVNIWLLVPAIVTIKKNVWGTR